MRPYLSRESARAGAVLALLVGVSACSGGSTSSSLPGAMTSQAVSQIASNPNSRQGTLAAATASGESTTSFTQAVIADSPAAFYAFTGAAPALADLSGNHLNGTLGSGVQLSSSSIVNGTSTASFPGGTYSLSNIASVPVNALLQPATAVSVEAWFIESASNANGQHSVSIASYGAESEGQQYVLHITTQNLLQFWLRTNRGAASVQSQAPIVPGTLYQVVGTYDGTTPRLYVNGQAVAGPAVDGSAINYMGKQYGLALGGAWRSTASTFQGKLGAVAIYPSALSASRVSAHFSAGTAAAPPSPPPSPVPTVAPVSSSNYVKLIEQNSPTAIFPLSDTSTSLTNLLSSSLATYPSDAKHQQLSLTSASGESTLFAGSANYAAIPATSTLPSGPMSVELWLNEASFNTTNAFRTIVCGGCFGSSEPAYTITVNPLNSVSFWLHTTNGAHVIGSSLALVPGVTAHIVATYDGNVMSLYQNGSLVSQYTQGGAVQGYSSKVAVDIGGGPNSAGFAGSLGYVSIFSQALSPAEVVAHYSSGSYAPMLSEHPAAASAFIDSIGVDMSDPDDPCWTACSQMLIASGIRHIREGVPNYPSNAASFAALATHGIKTTYITALTTTQAENVTRLGYAPQTIDAVEGPNEPDIGGSSNWPQQTLAYMQALRSTMNSTSFLSGHPLLAPALAGDQSELNVSSLVDEGNMHDYYDNFWPETPGWGGIYAAGHYGSLAYNLNMVALESGSKPIVCTETGWASTQSGSQSNDFMPWAPETKYIIRDLFNQFNNGVVRTFLFRFSDEPGGLGTFAYSGIVQSNGTPKASYVAVKSLIAALADSGSPNLSPISYQIAGNTANLHHTLLRKADGTYYLALWLGVQSWNDSTFSVVSVPTQTVNVTMPSTISEASQITLDSGGNASTTTLSPSGNSVAVPVNDTLSLVKLSI